MEASSTTLNISTPEPAKIEHNHKKNFGRYVAGCPKCMEKYPDGPPQKKAKAEPAPTITKEQILAILREEAGATAAPVVQGDAELKQLVQLMLNKEAKTLQKEEADAARKAAAREDMIRVVTETEAQKKAIQDACERNNHSKENGRSAISGQVHNDGKFHPLCQRCMKEFPPRSPQREELHPVVA